MKPILISITLFWLAAFGSPGAEQPVAQANVVAIKAGHLLDVEAGTVLERQVILIEGEVIKSVGPEGSFAIPSLAKTVDLAGATVLPGFIDCHTHITSQSEDYYADLFRRTPMDIAVHAHVFARRTLEAGFTSVGICIHQ